MNEIAIIGLGCHFPGARNSDAFWELLIDGVDAITEVPLERWDVNLFYDPDLTTTGKMNTRWGGFVEQIDQFDGDFFGISAQEAERMDPQQRLLLEVAWEALENAGLPPHTLAGSQTGVFVGIGNYDYHSLLSQDLSTMEAYSGSGTSNCIAPNRLSYLLDIRGLSVAIDTACSSSLVALHLACQNLQLGESDLCLVGGVNAILSPEVTISFSQAGMTAADGRCKTFDASADGYVRGEGCGMIVIKRLGDALRDEDNILAVVKGSAVNQDGLSNGLTAPNGPSQQAVIRRALEKAGVAPGEISYVETQGTGTSLGDFIEFKSLKSVLMEGRQPNQPCWMGSVKSNIGHLESAAGIAGLIKVILSMQHGRIPQQLHLKQLNQYIVLEETPFKIPTKPQVWPGGEQPRRAGVSAFGFGGTNCHVILEEAPIKATVANQSDRPVHLITLSAKTQKALKELAGRYQAYLRCNGDVSLADVCFTANTGRSHFKHRLAVMAETSQNLAEELGKFAKGEALSGVSNQVSSRKHRKIAFLFADQGCEYVGMGRQLYQTQPTFRQTLDYCNQILDPYLEKPLLSVLYPQPGETSPIHETAYNQSALFAIEYALAELWKYWGVKPDVVIGHGVGEYVAACVAGVFSLEDGLKLIASRERLMESLPTWEQIVAEVSFFSPQIDLIANVTAESATAEIATPQYWCNQMRMPLEFATSMKALKEKGCRLLVELSPTPTTMAMAQHYFPEAEAVLLPSLHPKQSDWQIILPSLGELYVRGVPVDWSGFERDYRRHRLQLPTYPFQRQRYWGVTAQDKQLEKQP